MAVEKGIRIGGRAKGTPNKNVNHLVEIAQKHNCDPYEILILYAKRDHKSLGLPEYKIVGYSQSGEPIEALSISAELGQKSAKDACEYIHAKRKAVEVSVDQETKESFEEYLQALDKNK